MTTTFVFELTRLNVARLEAEFRKKIVLYGEVLLEVK
jgi:hypothetical protein